LKGSPPRRALDTRFGRVRDDPHKDIAGLDVVELLCVEDVPTSLIEVAGDRGDETGGGWSRRG